MTVPMAVQGGDAVNKDTNWSRRSFLTTRGLGASAGGMLGLLVGDRSVPACGVLPPRLEVCYSRRAMACEFSVFLPPTVPCGMNAADAALDDIQALEAILTVYSTTSLMSYVNQNGFPGPVRTDGRIFHLLQRAAELTALTDGAFDVSAGALVRAWGFLKGPRRVPGEDEWAAAMSSSGMRHVELDEQQQTVRYRVARLEINLGAIGKGYAIDRAVGRLQEEYGVTSALIQGGLSSMRAVGSCSDDEEGWLVGIQNPLDPGRRVAVVRLRNRAMGTSSANRQHFEAGGRTYGHILDPRTGRPADSDLAGATVLAPDAATADALSTAFFLMGLDKVRDFCHNHPEIAALLVLQPGKSQRTQASPQIVTFNLTKKDYQLTG
ncbi:MAG TPA: FAD:protein FMN transferase [Phycisphaerae bacterium]|nr:FAD:protein FMN transferase [Phycisphaerae bacterium]